MCSSDLTVSVIGGVSRAGFVDVDEPRFEENTSNLKD